MLRDLELGKALSSQQWETELVKQENRTSQGRKGRGNKAFLSLPLSGWRRCVWTGGWSHQAQPWMGMGHSWEYLQNNRPTLSCVSLASLACVVCRHWQTRFMLVAVRSGFTQAPDGQWACWWGGTGPRAEEESGKCQEHRCYGVLNDSKEGKTRRISRRGAPVGTVVFWISHWGFWSWLDIAFLTLLVVRWTVVLPTSPIAQPGHSHPLQSTLPVEISNVCGYDLSGQPSSMTLFYPDGYLDWLHSWTTEFAGLPAQYLSDSVNFLDRLSVICLEYWPEFLILLSPWAIAQCDCELLAQHYCEKLALFLLFINKHFSGLPALIIDPVFLLYTGQYFTRLKVQCSSGCLAHWFVRICLIHLTVAGIILINWKETALHSLFPATSLKLMQTKASMHFVVVILRYNKSYYTRDTIQYWVTISLTENMGADHTCRVSLVHTRSLRGILNSPLCGYNSGSRRGGCWKDRMLGDLIVNLTLLFF